MHLYIPHICLGKIEEVYEPKNPKNLSKHHYEYLVSLFVGNVSKSPVRCVGMDGFGHFYDNSDTVFSVQSYVYIFFINGDCSAGVILGAPRKFHQPMRPEVYKTIRFNSIAVNWLQKKCFQIISDDGPQFLLDSNTIKLDDSNNTIELNKTKKTITLQCDDWRVIVRRSAKIEVTEKAEILAKNADIVVKDKVNLKCKDAFVEMSGSGKIIAKKNVEVQGQNILLNGGSGNVLTTLSQPTCYVTGAPFKGSSTVKAG